MMIFSEAERQTLLEACLGERVGFRYRDYATHLPGYLKKLTASVESENARGIRKNAAELLYGVSEALKESGDHDVAKHLDNTARAVERLATQR